MNDFTKEELQYLMQCVINDIDMIDNCGDDYDEINAAASVENKLQSLIDNYCEHDWREGMCQICKKCDAMKEY